MFAEIEVFFLQSYKLDNFAIVHNESLHEFYKVRKHFSLTQTIKRKMCEENLFIHQ